MTPAVNVAPVSAMARRITRGAVRAFRLIGILLLALITALLLVLWFEHRTEITLLRPTGPFAVGRIIDTWRDDTTRDTLAPVPNASRELLAWIWYPSSGA